MVTPALENIRTTLVPCGLWVRKQTDRRTDKQIARPISRLIKWSHNNMCIRRTIIRQSHALHEINRKSVIYSMIWFTKND